MAVDGGFVLAVCLGDDVGEAVDVAVEVGAPVSPAIDVAVGIGDDGVGEGAYLPLADAGVGESGGIEGMDAGNFADEVLPAGGVGGGETDGDNLHAFGIAALGGSAAIEPVIALDAPGYLLHGVEGDAVPLGPEEIEFAAVAYLVGAECGVGGDDFNVGKPSGGLDGGGIETGVDAADYPLGPGRRGETAEETPYHDAVVNAGHLAEEQESTAQAGGVAAAHGVEAGDA